MGTSSQPTTYNGDAYGGNSNPYQDEGLSYEEGRDETVDHRSPRPVSPDPLLEPVETAWGINRHGNEYNRAGYRDGTDEYRYNNQNGSQYEKHRDGSADFDSFRGFRKHYPASVLAERTRGKEHDRWDTRDASPGYPVASQNAPVAKGEDVQHQELANSNEKRAGGGRERYY